MDVVAAEPLRASSLRWQATRGAWTLTVVCKATYRLEPVESPLAAEPEALGERDRYRDDDPAQSLFAPGDLVPFKARVDVLLVGDAYAPLRQPTRSVVARVVVGELDKAVTVFGDRVWTAAGELREATKFTRLPLRWERAAGGPGTSNPVGVPADAPPDQHGQTPLPNLLVPGRSPSARGDFLEPAGFGPLAPGWPSRAEKLPRLTAAPTPETLREQPLPAGFDPAYFNAAPRDQQLDALREGERLVLENLHPVHPRLVTALPAARPRAVIERVSLPPEELALRADTLWIDTDRSICTVVWRAQLRLTHARQPGCVWIALERPDKPLSLDEVIKLARRGGEDAAAGDPPEPAPSVEDPLERTTDLAPEEMVVEEEERAPTRSMRRAPVPIEEAPPAGDPPTLATHKLPQFAPKPVLPFASPRAAPATPLPPSLPSAPSVPLIPRPAPLPRADLDVPPEPAPGPAKKPTGAPPSPSARPPAREIVELLWFDAAALPRLRRQRAFAAAMAKLSLARNEADEEARERREVTAVLAQGEPLGLEGIHRVMASSVTPEGGFVAPLVLVAGELSFPFDEEGQERALLEQRRYQKRALLGRRWIRALLTMPGAPAPVPTYVPEALADELPMFQRFRAHLVAQARPQLDQFESHPLALEAVALARVLPVGVIR